MLDAAHAVGNRIHYRRRRVRVRGHIRPTRRRHGRQRAYLLGQVLRARQAVRRARDAPAAHDFDKVGALAYLLARRLEALLHAVGDASHAFPVPATTFKLGVLGRAFIPVPARLRNRVHGDEHAGSWVQALGDGFLEGEPRAAAVADAGEAAV